MSRSVAITGALGNIGSKLFAYLAEHSDCPLLISLDYNPVDDSLKKEMETRAGRRPGGPPVMEWIQCDLTDPGDTRWRQALDRVQAVVHFAARNPFPDCTWDEASASYDMTLNTALAAADSPTVERYVFASSNHVMGGYKDPPLRDRIPAGGLHPDLPPEVGTLIETDEKTEDSTAYATAKLAGERLCKALAFRSQGSTTYCCIRIGWCQPGENHPSTISASGTPKSGAGAKMDEDTLQSERWFQGMWLSNPDMQQLFHKSIHAASDSWNHGFSIVNGMSNNQGMKWSLEEGRRDLGYEPADNAFALIE